MTGEFAQSRVAFTIQPGDRVTVTGASGFIGSAIVRALVNRGAQVTAVSLPGTSLVALEGLPSEIIEAELRDESALNRAFHQARVIFHVPPDYRGTVYDTRSYHALNVEDTHRVLDAARRSNCEKIVYTSSVGTLGAEGSTMADPANETSMPHIDRLVGDYKQSKYVAEHEVLRAGAEGLPVTLVLPTTSVGENDFTPTPSGRIILNFLNGNPANWFDTALNVVSVEDLAHGHILAAERGAVGRSYILGGENITYRELLGHLENLTGLRSHGIKIPRTAAMTAALMSEFFEGRILRKDPSVPLEGVRLATTPLIFSSQRAIRELGYAPRPAAESIGRAAHWFADNGYVTAQQLKQIVWSDAVASESKV